MTKDEAKYIAAGLNYLMQQIHAKETPCDHDSEGNVVAHTTSLITEVMEIEIEKIHAFIERSSETEEEPELCEEPGEEVEWDDVEFTHPDFSE